MPSLSAFAERDVYTRRVTRETDEHGLAGVRERADRGLHWAVGALVADAGDRILFVYEDDIWKLPGGGVEAGEGREAAVKREVREETGVEITVETLAAVTEVTVTTPASERSETFFFGTYRGTPETTALADDPGLVDEEIETVAWRDAVPENCLDHDLLRRLR
mgnify:CR=1 FL=1